MDSAIKTLTQRIKERSESRRDLFLDRARRLAHDGPRRFSLSCSNLAHAQAGLAEEARPAFRKRDASCIGIITSYNDMLSAHQPFERFPSVIRQAALERGGFAQVAGSVPAMCDGVTQGKPGMELSLFSRDVIAMSTAVALSHNCFDGVLCLGICDKIIPGMFMGAVSQAHMPFIFVPGGPMPSGLDNKEKVRIREANARGEVGQDALLDAECRAYHAPGTCTFYGTANTNQMMMEFMGLHLPGAAFVQPQSPLRDALTRLATHRAMDIALTGSQPTPICDIVDEHSVVNAMVGLLATGGSTNHMLHLVAMARAVGIDLHWEDFDALSERVPLLVRMYPNGTADINAFHQAGGVACVIRNLLNAGLLHDDVHTVVGHGLSAYTQIPVMETQGIKWRPCPETADPCIIRPVDDPFDSTGGLRVLQGNLGKAIMKVSAVDSAHWRVHAPARVFHHQDEVLNCYQRGGLREDAVVVLRFQGPRANGMPELHKLSPILGNLQDEGYQVALVTDGRMSGASGKFPAAIHVCPESAAGGLLARVNDGDMILLDAETKTLQLEVPGETLATRDIPNMPISDHEKLSSTDLFRFMRQAAGPADLGATVFDFGGHRSKIVEEEETP